MRKKRILLISAVFPPEQVTSAYMSYDLAGALGKEYDVTVIRPYPSRPIGRKYEEKEINIESQSFKTVLINSYTYPYSKLLGRMRESLSFGIQSAKYIKEHRKDIDYVYNGGWHVFGLYIVSKVCCQYNIPYMVPIQDVYPESLLTSSKYPGIIRWLIKKTLSPLDLFTQKKAAKVRTNSIEMAKYLSNTRGISMDKIVYAYNWQNENDFSVEDENKTNPKREKGCRFCYVGSINLHANVDLLIRAFCKANIPNSCFYIYGGGNQKEECVELVKELGADNIFFDIIARDKVFKVQSEFDVLLLALPTGNSILCTPSKLVSYMISGRPVIASLDSKGTACRVINESDCGIVVEPDNIDMIAEALKIFSQLSKEDLNKMGESGRNYALNNFSREKNLSIVYNAIRDSLINK